MEKKFGFRTRRIFNNIFRFRYWADWDRTKSSIAYLFNGFKRFFIPVDIQGGLNFVEAKNRFNLSDTELHAKQKGLQRLSFLMLFIALSVIGYMLYLLIIASYQAALIALVVVTFALVLSFRYSFWAFQIKQRKLGCTVEEWYQALFKGNAK